MKALKYKCYIWYKYSWVLIIFMLAFVDQIFGQEKKLVFDNYTTNNGLIDNYIDCVFQDKNGWIWIGTRMGIERFDGIKFKEYNLFINDTVQKEGLLIRHFFQNKENTLYVCYEEYGLAVYNRRLDRFESMGLHVPCLKDNLTAKDVIEDSNGNLWIASKQGVLKFNPKNQILTSYTKNSNSELSLSDNYIRKITLDNTGKLWIGTKNGLDYLDPKERKIVHFSTKYNGLQDDILDIFIDNKDRKWIGTSEYGIIIIDASNNKFQTYIPEESEQRSYKVNAIYQKSDTEFWIGTRGGLYVYNELTQNTRHFVNNELEDNSLVHNSILSILEDNNKGIWIGTRGGMSHLSIEKQAFIHYKSIPGNNYYLNNSEIYSIWIDNQQKVWLGTEEGGINILDRKKDSFKYLTTNTKNGLCSNCIKSILPIDDSNILIGTFQGGLNIYNLISKKTLWLKHDPDNSSSISSDIVWGIAKDKNDNIWIGTAAGLDLFDCNNLTFSHNTDFNNNQPVSWIKADSNNDLWLGCQVIKIFRPGTGVIKTIDIRARDVIEDSRNRFWLASENRGIVLCDKDKGIIKEYNENSGITSKLTFRIEEDNTGKLWISTANGLSCFDPEKENFKNYSIQDGLQSNQFYYGASYKGVNGEMYFGGINGLTVFNPNDIVENQFEPPIYITDLKIFNQSVNICSDNNAILSQSISEAKEIHIPYKLNVITLEFAALNYTNSNENRYKYKLEGFDNNWVGPVESRNATYTNLNPGEYTFRIIGSNNNNNWNIKGASLKISIDPPFYMTSWFRITFLISSFILLFVIIFSLFRFLSNKRELRRELEFEKEKAKQLHKLDVFKLKFLTNISHEIKTPLTLIISPLKKLIQQKDLPFETRETIKIIERNTQHLLKLVTQLLDHRKLEEGKLQIELKRGDIVSFCSSTFYSFKDIMHEKDISYSFKSVQNEIITYFDTNKLKHILNNIISNAIKYNKVSGHIDFVLHMVIEPKDPNNATNDRFIKIVIEDTGIGINHKDINKVFTRFYTSPTSTEITSTGIGLAFTKELIELHDGKIFVESEEGKGSKFIILLPIIEDQENRIIKKHSDVINVREYIKSKEFEIEQQNKKVILVIDDNKDILYFIESHFKDKYLTLLSESGKDGFDYAIEAIPDVIISDIMLPDIDGRKLCEKIKKDERTSHIPIIILSALSSEKNIINGLEKGADDYIPKPFDIMYLQKKIENFLSSREILKEKYSKQITLTPTNYKVTSPDEKFLKKALCYIEKNIDLPDLDIEIFAREMGVSRMQLYRKISALTNMSVKECITDIRLKRAAQILTQCKINISEVAYSVGFNDLSYFGKCFKNKYGTSPSEYRNKILENEAGAGT